MSSISRQQIQQRQHRGGQGNIKSNIRVQKDTVTPQRMVQHIQQSVGQKGTVSSTGTWHQQVDKRCHRTTANIKIDIDNRGSKGWEPQHQVKEEARAARHQQTTKCQSRFSKQQQRITPEQGQTRADRQQSNQWQHIATLSTCMTEATAQDQTQGDHSQQDMQHWQANSRRQRGGSMTPSCSKGRQE